LVDLRNVTFPHLASLLNHGTPIPIHGGQGRLLTVNIEKHSQLADRVIADVFEQFPDLLAVAIIRDQQVQLPRGSTRLAGGDQLLVVASETTSVEAFKRMAGERA
jgi:Trk K+ transport system NAD-binding subunit